MIVRKTSVSILFFSLLLISSNFFSQAVTHACGDNFVESIQRAQVGKYDEAVKQQNIIVRDFVNSYLKNNSNQKNNNTTTAATSFTIPVVFHVVYQQGLSYGSGSNITYAQIQSQLNALNAAFEKNYPAYNGESHPVYAKSANIKFCLAKNTMPATANWYNGPGGTEYGVMRYADNTGAYNHVISIASAAALGSITHPTAQHFPFANYLNIWLVNTISSGGVGGGTVMGYAPKPIMGTYPLDGLIIRSDICGDNSPGNTFSLGFNLAEGKVAAHEIGHYLNLYHIFQGGCSGMNAAGAATDPCDLNGDNICDTDPCTTQNTACGLTYNTCVATYTTGTTANDMIENYMSYADDDCMTTFTQDQCNRMWATLNTTRSSLWQIGNLAATGIIGATGCINPFLISYINMAPVSYCTGQAVALSNPVTGNTAVTRSWLFPGGTPATATTASTSVTYTAPGLYKAYLTVSDGTVSIKDSITVPVRNCTLDSSKLDRSNWYFASYASLSFATGTATPTNNANVKKTIYCYESSVTQNDSLGNLLFYSDGVSVWDKNDVKINTSDIFGWDMVTLGVGSYPGSSVPGFISVPYPKQPNKYILVISPPAEFLSGTFPASFKQVAYCVVDMNTKTVGPVQHLNSPLITQQLREPLTVVPHCNGVDYWIVTKNAGTTVYFYSFLITQNGLAQNTPPVISGPFASNGYGGTLKANKQGNKIVAPGPGNYWIYDFNTTTGVLSSETALPPYAVTYNGAYIPGIIFSPNGQYLYVFASDASGPLVHQIDVNNLGTPPKFLGAISASYYLEIGPDNTIYFSKTGSLTKLSQVINPDSWASSAIVQDVISFAGIVPTAPYFVTTWCQYGMVNFIESDKPAVVSTDFTYAKTSCYTYNFAIAPCWAAYTANWAFGDGAVGTGSTAIHTYTANGAYTVTLTLSYNGVNIPIVTKVVNVFNAAAVAVSGPTTVCVGAAYPYAYSVPSTPGYTYTWSTNIGNSVPTGPPNNFNVTYTTTGTDTIKVVTAGAACTINTFVVVNVAALPTVSLGLNPKLACVNTTLTLGGGSPAGGNYMMGGNNVTTVNTTTLGVGKYAVSYYYTNPSGCYGQAKDSLQVSSCIGIKELTENCNLKVYPNPAKSEVYFSELVKQVSIMDVSGKSIKTVYNVRSVNIDDLNEAIYIFKITDKEGQVYQTKIMKKE